MEYIPRYIEDTVLDIHRTFKVLYVGGPRQVGKTTMLKQLAEKKGLSYVTLDNLSDRKMATDDPELFLERHKAPLMIDEVQYAPNLFSAIKRRVDEKDDRGRYWLTGSQQWNMMKNLQESLAGRVGLVNLLGLSSAEIARRPKTADSLLSTILPTRNQDSPVWSDPFENIVRGFYPALHQPNAPDVSTFYNSYTQTYLDRDVRQFSPIAKTDNFETFLHLCAARTGQILNMSDLARDADVSIHAVKEWLNILQVGMQVYLLRPYFINISKRFVKAPKLYFMDTGLASFLTGWKDAETARSGPMAGALFETYVVAEIIKSYMFRGIIPPLSYIRDQEGHEIDLLIETGQKLAPVEIKLTASPSNRDSAVMDYWRKKIPAITQGAVVCQIKSPTPIDEKTVALPWGVIS